MSGFGMSGESSSNPARLPSDLEALLGDAPSLSDLPETPPAEQTASLPAQGLADRADASGNRATVTQTNAKERGSQLAKFSDEWKTSIFFSRKDIDNLLYVLKKRADLEQQNPDALAEFDRLMNPEEETKTEDEDPVDFPVFRLKSIVFDTKRGWSVFVNDRKLTRHTTDIESDIVPVSVSAQSVTLKWLPADQRIIDQLTAITGKQENADAIPDKNRISAILPAGNILPDRSVVFTLRLNQSFVSRHAAIYEGLPPEEKTDTSIAQTEELIQDVNQLNPEEILSQVTLRAKQPANQIESGPAVAPSESEKLLIDKTVKGYLSGIIEQSRQKIDTISQP
jgi:hypothetical protein